MVRYLALFSLAALLGGCALLQPTPRRTATPSPPPKSLSIKPRVVTSAPSTIKPPEQKAPGRVAADGEPQPDATP